jgi:hypothetical protein
LEPTERQVEEVFLRGYDRDLSRTDLVVEINGTKVRNKNRAEDVLGSLTEGDSQILLKVRHEGNVREVILKPQF